MPFIYIIVAIIVVVALWLIRVYNGIVRGKNRVDEAWSDIEVQLKRRYDLIPNLVNTVKGYATHEKDLFTAVTAARSAAMSAQDPHQKLERENMLSSTLKSLFAVAENYPDLKANENFISLQSDLTDTENKIQAARRFYNSVVRQFNSFIQVFPNNMVVPMFGFKDFEFFDIDEEGPEGQPVNVEF